jgi:hypothetical protein
MPSSTIFPFAVPASIMKAWADQHIDFTTGAPKTLVGEKAA